MFVLSRLKCFRWQNYQRYVNESDYFATITCEAQLRAYVVELTNLFACGLHREQLH